MSSHEYKRAGNRDGVGSTVYSRALKASKYGVQISDHLLTRPEQTDDKVSLEISISILNLSSCE